MRNYEFTVIFHSDDEKTQEGMDFMLEQFKSNGVEITKQEDMGVRQTAYPIKKQDKGHYYYFELNADGATINPMSQEFLLKSQILKFLFVAK